MSSLRELLASAGFHGSGLNTAVAVAMAESGGHPMSHNPDASTGDNSYGLFQINMLGSLGPARRAEFGLGSNDQLYDPLTNARIAFKMSQGGTNWTPWSTYKTGAYQRFLGPDVDTQIDTGSFSDPNSTGTHLETHSTGSDFDIGTGMAPTSITADDKRIAMDLSHVMGLAPSAGLTSVGPSTPNQDALHTFIDAAVAQRGDAYVFGAKGTGQADPTAFDCSGLTKWAAHQAGAELPDGAAHQFVALKQAGMLIPVDQAIHTPGALLFHFASEPQPGTGEPDVAHVAISLGNGKTIEAADPQDGVTEFNAAGRFNYAAIIPGIGSTSTAAAHATLADSVHPLDPGHDDLFSGIDTSSHLGASLDHALGTDNGFGHDPSGHGAGLDDHGGRWDVGHWDVGH